MTDTPTPGANRWFALAALLSANFLIILDLFIVNVSLPSLQTRLGASSRRCIWSSSRTTPRWPCCW